MGQTGGTGGVPSRDRLKAVSEVSRNEGEFQPQRPGAGKGVSLTLMSLGSILRSANICQGSHVSGMAQGDTEMN